MLSVIVTAVLVAIFLLLLVWDGLQKKNLHDINSNIKTYTSDVNGIQNINNALTVQNQLTSLPTLYNQDAVSSRLFNDLQDITPSRATISKFDINFSQNSISIQGDADTLITVNVFVDILKFTTYTSGTSSPQSAFSNVVLASFSRSDSGANYTITANFQPALFANTANTPALAVPSEDITRVESQQSSDLFKADTSSNSSSSSNGS